MTLTDEIIDRLALEGLNVVGAARGLHSYAYDITGYRRVPRLDTLFDTFLVWDVGPAPSGEPGRHSECALDRPYYIRLGGFERGRIYGADRIGRLLREHHVVYSDGPGNGKYESAMIARKYGLRVVFEASASDLPLPLTKRQAAEFEPAWEEQVIYMRDCCKRLGDAVGLDLVDDPDNMWIGLIGIDIQPLDVFIDQTRRNYDEVNADFHADYGFDLPLEASDDPLGVARRIRLWEYIRRRYSELALLQNTVLRRHVRGLVVGNLEFDTEPDYAIWGRAYDVPGFNLRTALFEDEIGYRHWVGYGTKLSADLTHCAPMISVRTNQVGPVQGSCPRLIQLVIGIVKPSKAAPEDSISGFRISSVTKAIRPGTSVLAWQIPTSARDPRNDGRHIWMLRKYSGRLVCSNLRAPRPAFSFPRPPAQPDPGRTCFPPMLKQRERVSVHGLSPARNCEAAKQLFPACVCCWRLAFSMNIAAWCDGCTKLPVQVW
jgi:hypothetical protein